MMLFRAIMLRSDTPTNCSGARAAAAAETCNMRSGPELWRSTPKTAVHSRAAHVCWPMRAATTMACLHLQRHRPVGGVEVEEACKVERTVFAEVALAKARTTRAARLCCHQPQQGAGIRVITSGRVGWMGQWVPTASDSAPRLRCQPDPPWPRPTCLGVDPQEPSHVVVVGQSGRQPHNADHALAALHLQSKAPSSRGQSVAQLGSLLWKDLGASTKFAPHQWHHQAVAPVSVRPPPPPHPPSHLSVGAGHQGLNDRATFVVQQVHLVCRAVKRGR